MSDHIEALVKPQMLIWARRRSGLDIEGAAKRVGVKPERLQAWENGDYYPTIKQAIRMAEAYKRPLSLFYLDEPPTDFSVAMTDFRQFPDTASRTLSPGLLWEKRLAEIRRTVMLELAEKQDEGSFLYLNTVSLDDDSEQVAHMIRSRLEIDWMTQRRWREPNEALNGWKEAIERQNVLVFHTSHQGSTFEPTEARGFSIAASRFPVIVLNTADSPRARIFTLLHEFTHLLSDAGGICDCWEYTNAQTTEQRTEVFCNRVAGAILVPASLLLEHELLRKNRQLDEWGDDEIAQLAQDFVASQEVIVRRLLILGQISQSFYERKRAEYDRGYQEFKKKKAEEGAGGFAPHHRLVLRKNGKPYTRLVLSAYYNKRITLADVSDFLGAKIKDVRKMEQEVFFSASGA
jgi:Zn-dependent peptidase ImmA (M78 family)/DNA-binding XRE family transcriptional regulator